MDRRSFLKASTLIATGGLVPEFLARAAPKVKPGEENVLVVVELNGGNDGLNTVIPYTDPLYYKARPVLGIKKDKALRLNDELGLHPSLNKARGLFDRGQLAVVLGTGYPNPNRSHFESMDVWHSADPRGAKKTGWIGRSMAKLASASGNFPAIHAAPGNLPLAFSGGTGAVSVGDPSSFSIRMSGDPGRSEKRKKLLEAINAPAAGADGLADFVSRRQVQTLKGVDALEALVRRGRDARLRSRRYDPFADLEGPTLVDQLLMVAELIKGGAGARIYYTKLDNFDTHSDQAPAHVKLLGKLDEGIGEFFRSLKGTEGGHDKRVILMTYSEFGRRVKENGSKGTDHGAASNLFLAGPAVKAGLVGKYPRLDDLDDGDLKYAIDFRRIYATLLDRWLDCPSKEVLGDTFEHLPLLAKA